jgi:hypothetical protein
MAAQINNSSPTVELQTAFDEMVSFSTSSDNIFPQLRFPSIEIAMIFFTQIEPYIMLVFGIPGNLTTLFVTLKKANRRLSTCIFMGALAVSDFAQMLTILIRKVVPATGYRPTYQEKLIIS